MSVERLVAALEELETALAKVRQALADAEPYLPYPRSPRQRSHGLAASEVVAVVAAHFGVTAGELISASRRREVTEARQAAMLVLHDHMGYSYSDVGRMLDRDHTTVMAGVARARQWDHSVMAPILQVLELVDHR